MRTVIVYRDKPGHDLEKIVLTGQAAKRASQGKGKGEDQGEKVAFHNQVLRGAYEAECDGAIQMTRREADFHKTVHKTAAECGGDLPPVGSTRLPF